MNKNTATRVKPARSIDGVLGDFQRRKVTPVTRAARSHAVSRRHPAAPSRTLMRSSVKKPTTSPLKPSTGPLAAAHKQVIDHKTSIYKIDVRRQSRAQQAGLSPRVAHFAHAVSHAAPIIMEEAVAALETPVKLPEGMTAYRHDTAISPQQRRVDVFEQALARATSHEQTAPVLQPRARRRVVAAMRSRAGAVSGAAAAVLLIAGFVGYQANANSVANTAASRAGFNVVMPGYAAAGYHLDNVQSMTGYVGFNYKSGTGQPASGYAVTESPSNLSSDDLINNITTADSTSQPYQTLKAAGGKTIYVYGRNQAAWVNRGVLYQIMGQGNLTVNDFKQLAASL